MSPRSARHAPGRRHAPPARIPIARALALGPALAIALSPAARAQTRTWDGSTNASWSVAANWSSNNVPDTLGETAVLDNGGIANQPTLDLNATVGQTNVTAGTLTIGAVLTSPVSLAGTGNLAVNAGRDLVGNVSKGGTGTLANNGTVTGNLAVSAGVCNNAGVVTGTTTISGGTLNVNAGSNLADAQSLTVNGGTVNLNTTEMVGTLSGTGGTIDIDNGVALTTNVASPATYAGVVTGAISTPNALFLAKAGAATLTLTGTSTISGPGRVAVSAGTLAVTGSGAIGDSVNIALASGAILQINGSKTIGALSGAGGAVALGSGTLTIAGMAPGVAAMSSPAVISGTGGVTVNAPGFTQTLSGANTYTGPTTINAGTLRLGTSNAIALGSSLVVNGGTFDLVASSNTLAGVSLQSGSIVGSGVLASQTPIDVRSGVVSAPLGGTSGLNKTGAGTVFMGAASPYVGPTSVSAGTLNLTGSGSVASAALNVSGGALNLDAGALPSIADVVLSGAGTLGVAGAVDFANLTQSGGVVAATVSGTIALTNAYAQSGGTTSGTLDINASTFSQSGGATIAAGTTVTSSGAQSLQQGTILGVLDGSGPVTVSIGTTTVGGRIDATSLAVRNAGTLRAGGAALSSAANLTVEDGLWAMTAPTMLQALRVDPNGTVASAALIGSYRPLMVASFIGGGRLELNSSLGATGSPTDQLIVSAGSVSGTTTVRVRNSNGPGDQTTGDGILLLEIIGASPANAFALEAPGFVRAGEYSYELAKVGDNWFLQSEFVGLFRDSFE